MLKILNRIKIAKPAAPELPDGADSALAKQPELPPVHHAAPTWRDLAKRLTARLEHAEGLPPETTMPSHQPSQRRPTR